LHLSAFRLTLDSNQAGATGGVATAAPCALSALRREVGLMHQAPAPSARGCGDRVRPTGGRR
jgi:hypothetical protein